MLDTRLTKESRDRALARLSESSRPGRELDVLVIGGGITGAGIALDAASRGLETVVVEAQDWGAGTSSRSSKLVHGGLRYLQMLDFKLVFEALAERDLLLTTVAPHLVVMSRQVVFDSADGRGSDRGVVPVMIVEVQPARECFAALSL